MSFMGFDEGHTEIWGGFTDPIAPEWNLVACVQSLVSETRGKRLVLWSNSTGVIGLTRVTPTFTAATTWLPTTTSAPG